MRTEFIEYPNGKRLLSLATIKELAEYIVKTMQSDKKNFHFPNFDLAIANASALEKSQDKQNYLENVYDASSGWYGMKEINTGFDSNSILSVVADYYGGGCANILNIWEDEIDELSYSEEIIRILINTMEIQEGSITENTIVIVEWNPYTFNEI